MVLPFLDKMHPDCRHRFVLMREFSKDFCPGCPLDHPRREFNAYDFYQVSLASLAVAGLGIRFKVLGREHFLGMGQSLFGDAQSAQHAGDLMLALVGG